VARGVCFHMNSGGSIPARLAHGAVAVRWSLTVTVAWVTALRTAVPLRLAPLVTCDVPLVCVIMAAPPSWLTYGLCAVGAVSRSQALSMCGTASRFTAVPTGGARLIAERIVLVGVVVPTGPANSAPSVTLCWRCAGTVRCSAAGCDCTVSAERRARLTTFVVPFIVHVCRPPIPWATRSLAPRGVAAAAVAL
jgi:hypothetical protein